MKRILSTLAIVIASVAFGVIISADLGLMRKSSAQSAPIQTASGQPVTSVTIPSFADVAARVTPAVVSIATTEVVKTSDLRRRQGGGSIDPFEFFFPNPGGSGRGQRGTPDDGDDEHAQRSGGSGFIISSDGYILTNNHVVEGATKVEVHYGADENGNGGHTATAKIIGRDPATDIALVKIDAGSQLPFVSLGDSDRIRKGDWAIAIGNPFQFENSLTVGVISAKGRSLGGISTETRSFENFIQTDAAINFGNSGGPLLNIAGEVVGINTAIRGGGAQGLGFATPINTARRLLPMLKQGKVTRGYLGMEIREVDERSKQAFGLPEARGAIVNKVEEGKPAEKAGIQNGDVIVEVDGRAIRNNRDLIDYISYLPVGTTVKVTVIRNGERKTLTAQTAQRPDADTPDDQAESSPTSPTRNKLGMSVQEMSPQLRQLYGIGDATRGVVVTSVKEVSPAGEANIGEGDVISEVQGQKIANVNDFRAAIERAKSGSFIRMYVTTPARGGTSLSGYRIVEVP
jgi:serine protease Do